MSDSPLNPVDVERKIEEVKNRIANGVKVVTLAERESKAQKRAFDLAYAKAYGLAERESKAQKRAFDLAYAKAYGLAEGSIQDRKYKAEIETMPLREISDDADVAYRHAERTAKALEKELFAWQSILTNIRTMYGAVKP